MKNSTKFKFDKFLFEMLEAMTLFIAMVFWVLVRSCRWMGGVVLNYFENLKHKGDTND